MLDFGIPVAACAVGGLKYLELTVGGEPTIMAFDHAAGSEVCSTASSSESGPSSSFSGQPGYGGGVPPNTGQWAWCAHQSHSRDGWGRKSPVAPADWMARQIAINVFSNRSSSSRVGE